MPYVLGEDILVGKTHMLHMESLKSFQSGRKKKSYPEPVCVKEVLHLLPCDPRGKVGYNSDK